MNWETIGQNLLLLAVGIVTAWNVWRANKNTATLNKVHLLVNHQMEMTQKSLAEVSMAKYLLTKDPMDKAAADAAMAAYLKHIERKSPIDTNETT